MRIERRLVWSRTAFPFPVSTFRSQGTAPELAGVLPYRREQGIAFLPFSPLGRGFLTGRFASPDDLPRDDFRRGLPRFQQDALHAHLAIVERYARSRAGPGPLRRRWRWHGCWPKAGT